MAMNIYEVIQAIRRGGSDEFQPQSLPEPTSVRPGPDKVAVFIARLEAGEELFHPDDAFSQPVSGFGRPGWRWAEPGLRLLLDNDLWEHGRITFDDDAIGGRADDDSAITGRFHGRGAEFPGPRGGRFRDRG
jgi:hypothetical protein